MADYCVCYTVDPGYVFPAFVSALQARANTDVASVDIILFAFAIDDAVAAAFGPPCKQAGIKLILCSHSQIGSATGMFARLFLAELLPPHYRKFLYIDGDTLIGGSLMPLLDYDVSGGRFLAANDPMTFMVPGSGRNSRTIPDHFASIGLSSEESALYFNSGVILADREGWAQIGADAWRLFKSRSQGWIFSDQDVLNVAGGSRHLPLSLAWNFPIYMRNARVEALIAPRIIHYMSKPKPWQGVFPPWNRAVFDAYVDAVRRFPGLAPYHVVMPLRGRLRYHLQQRYKRLTEFFSWGFSVRRRRILDYETRLAVLHVGPGA